MGIFEYTADKLAGSTVADKWMVFARLMEMMKHFENVPAISNTAGRHRTGGAGANRIQAIIPGTTGDPRASLIEALEALGIHPGAVRAILRP